MNSIRTLGAGVWSLGFRLLGVVRSRTAPWMSKGGPVLVIAPHPDDELVGCGGAILEHVRRGDPIRIIYVTDGRRSRAGGLSPDEMARKRKREATAAARALGVVSFDWLGLHEGDWDELDLRERFIDVLRDFQPTMIYAPSKIDFHPEHVRVAQTLSAALVIWKTACLVRIFQIQVPLTSILTNVVLTIDDGTAALQHVVDAYPSQQTTLLNAARLKTYAGRAHGITGAAEEYWELGSSDYIRVHRNQRVVPAKFRGLRSVALTDPLAYLVGRGLRRGAKRAVSHPG